MCDVLGAGKRRGIVCGNREWEVIGFVCVHVCHYRGCVCPSPLPIACWEFCFLLFLLALVPLACTRQTPRNGKAEQIVAATFTCQQLIKGLSQEPRRFSSVEIIGNVTCMNEDWPKAAALKIKTDLIIRGKEFITNSPSQLHHEEDSYSCD